MDLKQYFDKGIDFETYVSQMESHKENMQYVYENFKLPAGSDLSDIKDKDLRVLVISEDWCGDAMMNMPILRHIADEAGYEVRIVYRDQNLELMDQYLTNGGRSIPKFIYLDENFNYLGNWGPRAESVQKLVDERKALLPHKDTAGFKDAQQAYINDLTEQYRTNETLWNEVYESIRASFVRL